MSEHKQKESTACSGIRHLNAVVEKRNAVATAMTKNMGQLNTQFSSYSSLEVIQLPAPLVQC